jgi:hypothetical protein
MLWSTAGTELALGAADDMDFMLLRAGGDFRRGLDCIIFRLNPPVADALAQPQPGLGSYPEHEKSTTAIPPDGSAFPPARLAVVKGKPARLSQACYSPKRIISVFPASA